ncbi:3-oxoacyl-ACP synthase [Lewinella sp. IMCC34191]|uniref:3-oxoacyl-ACP synthase n=1 Tax=Lewinella sp. IMCC34191 TaxID=2259172 RepID=UPI000E2462EC|nr:3-oxoacyl-ACP synthase [Lewinella sp. IMCC34191]
MQNPTQTKAQLHEACQADVARRIATVRNILAGIHASRESETKSSVGDKYETGRAMLHREEAQAGHQLQQAMEAQRELDTLEPDRQSDRVRKGSLVVTTRGRYYLAVGLGKVKLDGEVFYCISAGSPIGQELLNRGVGEEIVFNGGSQRILEIY